MARKKSEMIRVFVNEADAKAACVEENLKLTPGDSGRDPVGYKPYRFAVPADWKGTEDFFVIERQPSAASLIAVAHAGLTFDRVDAPNVPSPQAYAAMLSDEQMKEMEKIIRERKKALAAG